MSRGDVGWASTHVLCGLLHEAYTTCCDRRVEFLLVANQKGRRRPRRGPYLDKSERTLAFGSLIKQDVVFHDNGETGEPSVMLIAVAPQIVK